MDFPPPPKTDSQPQQDDLAAFDGTPGRYDYPPPPVPGEKPPNGTLAGTIPGASILAATLHGNPTITAGTPARIRSQGQVERQIPQDIGAARSRVEAGLSELRSLQLERRRGGPNDIHGDERLRAQAADVLDDLRALGFEVAYVVRVAKVHRWRRWLFGGLL